MKKIILLSCFMFLGENVLQATIQEKKMVVLIPSYNNQRWYKKNLDSVFEQEYSNYRVIYIDDCSPDGTAELVEAYLKENRQENRTLLIKNKKRVTAMENIYKGIHFYCEDDEIVVKLDGDDWFAHSKVLARINQEYQDPNIWLTYGNFRDEPLAEGYSLDSQFCKELPNKNDTSKIKLRDYYLCGSYTPGHPLTFYAALFKKIPLKDILYEGKMPIIGYDGFMNFPMMEMARYHHKFIKDILYLHNIDNPINDNKVNAALQTKIGIYNTEKLPYPALETLEIKKPKEQSFIIPLILSSKLIDQQKVDLRQILNQENDKKYFLVTNGNISRFIDIQNCLKYLNSTGAICAIFNVNKKLIDRIPNTHLVHNIYAIQLSYKGTIDLIHDDYIMLCKKDYLMDALDNTAINSVNDLRNFLNHEKLQSEVILVCS